MRANTNNHSYNVVNIGRHWMYCLACTYTCRTFYPEPNNAPKICQSKPRNKQTRRTSYESELGQNSESISPFQCRFCRSTNRDATPQAMCSAMYRPLNASTHPITKTCKRRKNGSSILIRSFASRLLCSRSAVFADDHTHTHVTHTTSGAHIYSA